MGSGLSRWAIVLGVLVGTVLLAACASPPRFQGMDAEALYEQGVAHYEAEEWDDAIETLEHLLAVYPGYGRAAQARYYLSKSLHGNEDYLSAVSEYVRILNRGVGDSLVPMASLGICEAYAARSPIPARDQTYTRQALTSCQEVVRDHASLPEAARARDLVAEMRLKLATKDFLTGEFYMRRRLHDSAIQYFEEVVASYPETPMAPRALQQIYEAYTAIGYDDLAQEARDRLVSNYPDSEAAQAVQVNGQGSPSGR